ncbi:hypothetical protein DL93DRAFT_1211507 [Clavulina sp. PMI_390]|nr:hypothetical protein DL93DRAFT_1211507 [Clavulina sp. PMI_390]
MPRLSAIYLTGSIDESPTRVFEEPSSLSALWDVTIAGVPTLPVPNNPAQKISLSVAGGGDFWTLPFIKTSTNVTILQLLDGDAVNVIPSKRILLPNLKVLYQTELTISPFLEAPALEELYWIYCWLGVEPNYSCVSSFPTITKLYMSHPFPYHHDHPPWRKLDFPRLTNLLIDEAEDVRTFLRGLLLPQTLDPNGDVSDGAKPAQLPYPSLQMIEPKATSAEDLDMLRGVLETLLRSYQHLRLAYDMCKTSPVGDERSWGEMRQAYRKRVFAISR